MHIHTDINVWTCRFTYVQRIDWFSRSENNIMKKREREGKRGDEGAGGGREGGREGGRKGWGGAR